MQEGYILHNQIKHTCIRNSISDGWFLVRIHQIWREVSRYAKAWRVFSVETQADNDTAVKFDKCSFIQSRHLTAFNHQILLDSICVEIINIHHQNK